MTTTYIPVQHRINDPYQQRILQFNNQDSRVYLSRISNYLLKSIGNDAIINGFDILSYGFTDNIFEVVIDTGILIQDVTLIEATSPSTLSIDVSGLDDCNGYLLVYTDYQYIESISKNVFSLKIAHTTSDGLVFTTDSNAINWQPVRNRIYLTSFRFTKGSTNIVQERTNEYLYLGGYKYEKRGGLLNFFRTIDDVTGENDPYYFNLSHQYEATDSLSLIPQLVEHDGDIISINNLQLSSGQVSVCVDEYRPFTDPLKLLLNNPDDAITFTISNSDIPMSGSSKGIYELEHNLDQKYNLIQVYDDQNKLIRPRYINFTDENTITISFENMIGSLSSEYTVIMIKDYMISSPIIIDDSTEDLLEIIHNLNRLNVIIQLVEPSDNLYSNINNSIFNISVKDEITFNTSACDLINGTYNIMIYMNVRMIYLLYNNNSYRIPYHVTTGRLFDKCFTDNIKTLEHTFEDDLPGTALVDGVKKDIFFANETNIVDEDKVNFSFLDPSTITGRSYVYSYEGNTVYSLTSLTSGSSGGTLVYTLDISGKYYTAPVFQVYDSNNNFIFPQEIREIEQDEIYEFDFPDSFDPTNVDILVIQGFDQHAEIFNSTSVNLPNINLLPDFIQVCRLYDLDHNGIYYLNHNHNDLNPSIGILDNDRNIAYAEETEIINENQVAYSFTDSVLGGVLTDEFNTTVYSFAADDSVVYSLTSLTSGSSGGTLVYTLDISGDDFVDPVFQVFDGDNLLIFPQEIREIEYNNIYEFDFPSTFDPTDVTILTVQGYETHSAFFTVTSEYDPVIINHTLKSSYLVVQVFDSLTGEVVYPEHIQVIDNDNLKIITNDMSLDTTYKVHISNPTLEYVPIVVSYHSTITPLFHSICRLLDLNSSGIYYLNHNLRDPIPALGMLDSNSNIAYAEETEIINMDQVAYSFTNTVSGGLEELNNITYAYSSSNNVTYSLTSLTSGSSGETDTYVLDISEDDFTNPVFQVFDGDDLLIFPQEIREIEYNNIYEFDFPSTFDPTDVLILSIQGYNTYSTTFTVTSEYDPVMIDHILESSYLMVQVFDTLTGEVVYPEYIQAVDDNHLEISTNDMSLDILYKIHVANSPPEILPVSINHNLNSEYLLVQLLDVLSGQVIYPENIRVIDENNISIYLSGTSLYKVNIATGLLNLPIGIKYKNGFYYEFTDEHLNDGILNINHNLNFSHPIVQVYDNNDNQIQPEEIIIIDNDNIKVIFPIDTLIISKFKVIIITSELQK